MPNTSNRSRSEGLYRYLHYYYAMLTVLIIIAIRAAYVQLEPNFSEHLQSIARQQYTQDLTLSPYRGTIFDRRGNALAISIRKYSIFVNPRVFEPTAAQMHELGSILKIAHKKIEKVSSKKTYFSWLKRKINKSQADRVLALNIQGIHSIMEPARFYPYGKIASHLVGISGIDDKGLMGLEKQFDESLKGKVNQISQAKDAKGQPIFLDSQIATPQEPGLDLHTTLDLALQEIAENALKDGITKAKAKRGFVLIQDPHTGDILALAIAPNFDPNNIGSLNPKNNRPYPLVDPYEPGSVIKPLLIAAALDQGKISLQTKFDCEESGVYGGNKWKIRDSHPNGILTAEEVLIKSSNICTYKISKLFDRISLFAAYQRFGLSSRNQFIGFPGQSIGYIPPFAKWTDLRQANISFGQGLMTTALEISGVYSLFANGGKLTKPRLVRFLKSSSGSIIGEQDTPVRRQIIAPETAKKVTSALIKVVEKGTATAAQMQQYSAAGKTGTSEKLDPKTKAYSDHLRIASFIGYTPATDPHLVIYVWIDEPGIKPYYGGKWAAPVFKRVALESLQYLNVRPDKDSMDQLRVAKGVLPAHNIRD